MLMFLCIFYVDDVFNRWRHQSVNMAFSYIVDFKCKFLHVDKTLVADITVKVSESYAVLGKWIKYIC